MFDSKGGLKTVMGKINRC